jgi:hypothetical protein
MKTIKERKIFIISLLCIACAIVFACENPMMAEILQEKTISFNSNGGSPVPSQKLFKNRKVERPDNPSKGDAIFIDWYEDNETFNKAWDFGAIPQTDLTLHAKWVFPTFNNVDDLKNYLENIANNDPNNPYTVVLNVDDPNELKGVANAIADSSKYVILDLSGSTIIEIPENVFSQAGVAGGNGDGTQDLVGIILPYGVNKVGEGAFQNCINLANVTFPARINNIDIGAEAFSGCTGLTNVTFPVEVGSITIGGAAFSNCTNLTSVTFPVEVDNSIKISQYAFSSCKKLTSVTFPVEVYSITIMYYAFEGCTSLESITIPAAGGKIYIEEDAFNGCNFLNEVTFLRGFQGGIDEIKNNAFLNWSNDIYQTYGAGTYIKVDNGSNSKTWVKQP